MNYQQTLEFLEILQPRAMRLELAPLAEACGIMGNPQEQWPSVHISGTNGKGSTSAFLASILEQSGYRVGLYTSPHIVDLRERIQVNRRMISEGELTGLVERIREALPDDRTLTYFEFMTLAAFLHFVDVHVDIAVLETGLGGRLDATNMVQPKVAVITPVSLDHMQHLGATLREIAIEKCGIIKRGVPTVVAYQPPEVMEVVRRICDDVGSPLCLATPDEINVPLGLSGEHQKQNAACAVEAAHLLSQAGFHIGKVDEALAATRWPGRLETVHESPRVILDGAHNVAGAETLASYVHGTVDRDRAVLVIGVLADKDVAGMLRQLAPNFREIICVRAPSHRAASPKDIAAAARSSGAHITIDDDLSGALTRALPRMGANDTIFVSGSLTVVGEAKSFFAKAGSATPR